MNSNVNIDKCCIACLSKDVKQTKPDSLILILYNGLISNIEDDVNFQDILFTFCHVCEGVLLKFAEFKRNCIKAKLILQQNILREKEEKRSSLDLQNEKFPFQIRANDDDDNLFEKPPIEIKTEDDYAELQINDFPVELKLKNDSEIDKFSDEQFRGSKQDPLELPKHQNKPKSIRKRKKHIKDPTHPNYMVCHFCGDEFLNRYRIITHVRRNHLGYNDDTIRIVCLACDEPVDKLRQHVYSLHYYEENNQIHCRSCSYSGSNKTKFYRHFERIHTKFEHPKRCPQCNDTFTNQRDLANHINRVHLRLVCKLCGIETKQTRMEYHIKVNHEGKRGCATCRYWFETEVEERKHNEIHQSKAKEVNAIICNECGYSTIHPTSYRDHIRQHHSKNDKTSNFRQCKVCSKDCGTYYALKLHMAAEHKPKTVKCDYCEQTFCSASFVKRHIENYHPNQECKICGKKFSLNRLKKHIKLAHNQCNPYRCKICEITFKNLVKAKGHIYNHSTVSPFHCHLCARGYTAMKNMKSHYAKIHNLEMNVKEIAKVAVRGNISISFDDVIETEATKL